jgi:beta-N-acetylhexosaminidase
MVDSHLALPVVNHDKERLEKIELYPFKEAIKHGVKAIMSAHIEFPAYEPGGFPGTLSYNILTKLLREDLGFDGVLVTDCMQMKAIDDTYTTAKAAPMAIAAGADLLCISHSREKQIGALEEIAKALEEGRISEARLEKSIERIMKLKKEYDVDSFLNSSFQDALTRLYQEQPEALADRVSDRSITMAKNSGLIPITARDILVIAPSGRVMTGADGTRIAPNFAKVFAEKVSDRQVQALEVANAPTPEEINAAVAAARSRELVIVCTLNAVLEPKQVELVNAVAKVNQNLILVPMRLPYDVEKFKNIGTAVIPYEYTPRSMNSLIKVLMGEITAEGVIPVTLNL